MKLILVMASTADGITARNPFDPVDWTGRADKKQFAQITHRAGVVIMGSHTFDMLTAPLPGRLNIVMTRDQKRKSDTPQLLFTSQTPEEIVHYLEGRGFNYAALIGGPETNSAFMEKDLIDEIHLTMVPRLFGVGSGLFNAPVDRRLYLQGIQEIEPGHLIIIFRVLGRNQN